MADYGMEGGLGILGKSPRRRSAYTISFWRSYVSHFLALLRSSVSDPYVRQFLVFLLYNG